MMLSECGCILNEMIKIGNQPSHVDDVFRSSTLGALETDHGVARRDTADAWDQKMTPSLFSQSIAGNLKADGQQQARHSINMLALVSAYP